LPLQEVATADLPLKDFLLLQLGTDLFRLSEADSELCAHDGGARKINSVLLMRTSLAETHQLRAGEQPRRRLEVLGVSDETHHFFLGLNVLGHDAVDLLVGRLGQAALLEVGAFVGVFDALTVRFHRHLLVLVLFLVSIGLLLGLLQLVSGIEEVLLLPPNGVDLLLTAAWLHLRAWSLLG